MRPPGLYLLPSEWRFTDGYLVYSKSLHVRAKSLQSCLTPCDPIDYSLPGSSAHEILQTRILG